MLKQTVKIIFKWTLLHLSTSLTTSLSLFQSAILGNGLVLQNLLHMQMAQQQLLQIKDKHVSNVSVCVCP